MKPGETLGHYRIDKRLGVGGMGEVYLAVDTKLNRPVALKILRKEFFSDPDRQRRFVQEARAASALDHPNIVTIYDIAEQGGLHFIVMQYVSGRSLGELIRNEALDVAKALDVAIQIADGLARAHRDGIVHRDLKPDNVMVSDEGRARIVDFGLAKLTEPLGEAAGEESPTRDMKGPLTREGEILGTGAYMSPEQALGKEIDARSDIFSFGSVLYEMVTGERAFPGESIASVLAAIMRDEPRRVSELQPTIPAGLEAVIERSLVKNREERFQTMEEVREALVAVKEGGSRKPAHSKIVRIGEFEVDLEAAELRKQNRKVKLQGMPFELLAILLERPGRVVSRDELFKRLWPADTFVDFDNSVNAAVNKLRAALGDSAGKPRYVETVPRRGYRFIGPLGFADGSQSAALEPADLRELEQFRAPRRLGKYAGWAGGVLLVAAIAVVAIRMNLSSPESPLPPPRTRPLTSFEGGEYDPALSPDGNQVAFVWDGGKPGGSPQLNVKLIDGTDTLQLTDDDGAVVQPVWSPDGRQIAFLRGQNWAPRQEIFIVSALGGDERRVSVISSGQAFRHKLSWSPDGQSLAFVDQSRESSEPIFLLSLDTGARRQHTSPPSGSYDSNPTFSPDGKTIAFVRSKVLGLGKADGYLIAETGGEETRLTIDKNIWALDWTSDGGELIYSALDSFGQSSLWRVSREGGEPERLPFGTNANLLSIARNANLLAYAQSYLHLNLWRVGGPTLERPALPERLIASTYWDIQPRFSPDGSRLAFATTRSGQAEVWICDRNGADCGRLTPGWEPAWSPDGTQIAFSSPTDAGATAVFLIEAAGGFPRRLTESGDGNLPSWSHDGRFVYFGSFRTGRPEVWKIAAAGGNAQQITQNGGLRPFESEDGRFVYFARHLSPRRNKIWRLSVEGGEEMVVLDEEPDFMDWLLWGDNLVYFNPEGKDGPAIELFDLDDKRTRELVSLPNRGAWGGGINSGFTLSPDGQWVVYTQLERAGSDLMLVENFR